MNDLYAKYLSEREGFEVIRDGEKAFITYKFQDDGSVYIRDLYVHPDFRREKIGSGLADMVYDIAKEKNAKIIWGSVSSDALGAHESLCALIGWGMRFQGINEINKLILFSKEVK